jgi:hypothetical protein
MRPSLVPSITQALPSIALRLAHTLTPFFPRILPYQLSNLHSIKMYGVLPVDQVGRNIGYFHPANDTRLRRVLNLIPAEP